MQPTPKRPMVALWSHHSFRHASITYKLKLTRGDIKAVQGDSGHAQAQMITDQYSHILDEGRQENARLFEEAFYSGQGATELPGLGQSQAVMAHQFAESGLDVNTLMTILGNPEMVNLLKSLAKTLGK